MFDTRSRMSAGSVLGMMDVCAARSAMLHVFGSRTISPTRKAGVTTIAADNTTFRTPILDGDAIHVMGTVVYAGNSSVGVYVEVSRVQFPTGLKQTVSNSFFTMVAIDQNLAAAKIVPPLVISNPAHGILQQRFLRMRNGIHKTNEFINTIAHRSMTASDVENPVNASKANHRSFESTKVEANRLFFPGFLNLNNTIFGGEIIRWMESHAVHCGRMFAANRQVVTIGMHSVTFCNPVFLHDWVSLEAHVVYVRNTTMEVDVIVSVEREDSPVRTNRASFVLLNLDDAGLKREITTGLKLQDASTKWLRAYACAKYRYEGTRNTRFPPADHQTPAEQHTPVEHHTPEAQHTLAEKHHTHHAKKRHPHFMF